MSEAGRAPTLAPAYPCASDHMSAVSSDLRPLAAAGRATRRPPNFESGSAPHLRHRTWLRGKRAYARDRLCLQTGPTAHDRNDHGSLVMIWTRTALPGYRFARSDSRIHRPRELRNQRKGLTRPPASQRPTAVPTAQAALATNDLHAPLMHPSRAFGLRQPAPPATSERPICRQFQRVELAGLEPATSWVRSRRSPN